MPKDTETKIWWCDECGEFAEYHVCIDKHRYFCQEHWKGYLGTKDPRRPKWERNQNQQAG